MLNVSNAFLISVTCVLLRLTMPAVLHDGSMRDLHVDAGDAYIHRDTGIVLSLFLSDGTGRKVGYVLKHADPSVEPFKDLLHGARDRDRR